LQPRGIHAKEKTRKRLMEIISLKYQNHGETTRGGEVGNRKKRQGGGARGWRGVGLQSLGIKEEK